MSGLTIYDASGVSVSESDYSEDVKNFWIVAE